MAVTASTARQRDDLEVAAYTVDQLTVVLGLSRPSIYKLIENGRLRSVMVGRRRLIPATEITRLLEND